MKEQRLHYIDIAKGFLILMVVYGHIDGTATQMGFVNSSIDDIHKGANWFVSFYMPCFFVITGYCSNFTKSFKVFIVASLKSIVLPAFVFSFLLSGAWIIIHPGFLLNFVITFILYGGNYWFLSALFVSRLLYWFIYRLPISANAAICVVSFIIGFYYSSLPHKYELWWFVHALCLLPYLGLGQLFKQISGNILFKYTKYYIALYVFLFFITVGLSKMGLLQKDCFFDVPGVTQGFINLNLTMFIPLFILSVSGSLAILGFSEYISSNHILEFLGKNSLVIYCVQGLALKFSIAFISQMGGADFDNNYFLTLTLLLFSFIIAVIACSIISWIMNLNYLRYAIGKF